MQASEQQSNGIGRKLSQRREPLRRHYRQRLLWRWLRRHPIEQSEEQKQGRLLNKIVSPSKELKRSEIAVKKGKGQEDFDEDEHFAEGMATSSDTESLAESADAEDSDNLDDAEGSYESDGSRSTDYLNEGSQDEDVVNSDGSANSGGSKISQGCLDRYRMSQKAIQILMQETECEQ